MYILGLNSAYHESAACLLRDGVLIAAAEEERFNRVKHAKPAAIHNPHHLPKQAINFCLAQAGITPAAVAHIGYSINPANRLTNKNFVDTVTEGDWGSSSGETTFHQNLNKIPARLQQMGFTGQFHWLDHHHCHAASAFYPSPFAHAAVLSIDGIGETGSTLLALGQNHTLTPLQEIRYPASLGFLWEKISKFLGFTEYDAYKVMGLAAYGDPHYYLGQFNQIAKLLPCGNFALDNQILRFRINDYSALTALFGLDHRAGDQPLTRRHQDIAAALQKITNDIVQHLARHLFEQTAAEDLCLAGGVALNCITNQIVFESGPFKRLFIQPAAHDAGTALGAALLIWHNRLEEPQRRLMTHAYTGPSFSAEQIEPVLRATRLVYKRVDNIEKETAALLSKGAIVGWFQGAMEWGPRALGNRSLLADPRHPTMRDTLNIKVKHREEFRPFAPSVLAEEAHHWFDIGKTTPASDFMLMGYPVKTHRREQIPAVVHHDGTSRIQTVHRSQNPRYHRLISEFFKLTGVPMLLNTSFNDSEPIVCTPKDAVQTFLATKIDYLAIGDFLVRRETSKRE